MARRGMKLDSTPYAAADADDHKDPNGERIPAAWQHTVVGPLKLEIAQLKEQLAQQGGGADVEQLKAQIAEKTAAANDVIETLRQEILRGRMPIEISPDQITDEVGSDRRGDWEGDEEFKRLLDNIRESGQAQPIRVRPLDPDWTPDPDDPLAVSTREHFVLQSGRRRAAACRILERPVLAFVSVDIANLSLSDLEERYFENTMRVQLSTLEELLAIGAIRKQLSSLSQAEVAERVGRPRTYVSRGQHCLEHQDQLLATLDPATATFRQIEEALDVLKKGDSSGSKAGTTKKAAAPRPHQTADLSNGKLILRPNSKGMSVSVAGVHVTEENAEGLVEDLKAVFEKYAGQGAHKREEDQAQRGGLRNLHSWDK